MNYDIIQFPGANLYIRISFPSHHFLFNRLTEMSRNIPSVLFRFREFESIYFTLSRFAKI